MAHMLRKMSLTQAKEAVKGPSSSPQQPAAASAEDKAPEGSDPSVSFFLIHSCWSRQRLMPPRAPHCYSQDTEVLDDE